MNNENSENLQPPLPAREVRKRGLLAILIILLVIVTDQCIKYAVKTHFSLHESLTITSWFQLLFTENRGMAFGMDFVGTLALAVFRIIAIGFFVYVLIRQVKSSAPLGLLVCISLIIAGASGNILDNMFNGLIYSESLPYADPAQVVPFGHGYGNFMEGRVIDMFYFPLFTWPDWMPVVGNSVFFGAIFNFADAAISCGAVALVLFYYKRLNRSGIFK